MSPHPKLSLSTSELAARDLHFSRSIVCPKCGMRASDPSLTPHTFDYVWPTGWTTARALSYDIYLDEIEWETGKEEQVDMVPRTMPFGETVPSEHLIHRIGADVCCIWRVEPRPKSLEVVVYDMLASLGIAAPTKLLKKYYALAETHVLRTSSASTAIAKEIAVEILVRAMEDQRSSEEE